MPVIIIIFY